MDEYGKQLNVPNNTRWWAKFEQLFFIHKGQSVVDATTGLDIILRVAERSVLNGYCKETSSKLVKMLHDPWQRADMEVELSVTCLYGKIFAESTYLLEGDQPLWSQVYDVMFNLGKFLSSGPTDEQWKPIKDSCDIAAELVQDLATSDRQLYQEVELQVTEMNNRLTRITSAYERATDRIRNRTGVIEVNNTPTGHQANATMRTINRRRRRTTDRGDDWDNAQVERNRQAAQRLSTQKDNLSKELKDLKEKLNDIQKKISKHPRVTAVQFEQHAKDCVRKATMYFRQKFVDDEAPLKALMDLFDAARICDPTVLINTSIDDAQNGIITLSTHIYRVSANGLRNELEGTYSLL